MSGGPGGRVGGANGPVSGGPDEAAVLVVNPSPDVYGADLQMLETVAALVERGRRVVVAVPRDGPLVARLEALGAEVVHLEHPVLSKAVARPAALPALALQAGAAVIRAVRFLRLLRPAVVLVNTVTLPWWLLAGRLCRLPVVCHLHEAEPTASRAVRRALVTPLRLADAVIVNSRAALRAMTDADPALAGRARLVYNGVPEPLAEPGPPVATSPFRFVVVGRLSPRKAPDVAIRALALLRRRGVEATLEIVGTAFPGYEWYERELRDRAADADVAGSVTFSGYRSPIGPVLEHSYCFLAPSVMEPFGNAVVEAQLCRRPVVAAAAQGHLETVADGVTGLLVEPGSAQQMAAAMERLCADPGLAARLAGTGRAESLRRFSVSRYRREVVEVLDGVVGR